MLTIPTDSRALPHVCALPLRRLGFLLQNLFRNQDVRRRLRWLGVPLPFRRINRIILRRQCLLSGRLGPAGDRPVCAREAKGEGCLVV